MKLILTFCEGAHDTAFIFRILKEYSYTNYTDKKIDKFPEILNKYFTNLFKKFEYLEEKKFYQTPFLPRYVLKSKEDDIYILLYMLNSVSNIKNSIPIIEEFRDYTEDSFDFEKIDIGINFILDAEDKTVEKRINIIKQELKETLIISDNLQNGQISKNINNFKFIGIFIFSDENNQGKLEDVLLPLMKVDNENIVEKSSFFLKENQKPQRKKFDFDKSLIGIIGQLQLSGKANTVIITDSKYLTKEKIENNVNCQTILNLFNIGNF